MRWLKALWLMIRANLTALFEWFEDPSRVLNQLILDMEEELAAVRAKVAGVIADEIQLKKQVDRASQEASQWQERAATALRSQDETGARAALEQKVAADRRAAAWEKEYQKHEQETAKLHRAVGALEQRIRQAQQRRSLLVARLARADSANTVNDILRRTEGSSALAQFQRLEHRVERTEAMEVAYDRLEGRDPQVLELERQFEQGETKARLQQEFDALKRRLEAPE